MQQQFATMMALNQLSQMQHSNNSSNPDTGDQGYETKETSTSEQPRLEDVNGKTMNGLMMSPQILAFVNILQQQQQHQQQQEEEEGDLETFATSSQHLPLPLCGSPKSGDDPDSSASSSLLIASTVWGPTCDGLDRVCPHVNLPALQRDDWLVFPHISPSTTQGTAFNGFSPPDAVYCVLGYFH